MYIDWLKKIFENRQGVYLFDSLAQPSTSHLDIVEIKQEHLKDLPDDLTNTPQLKKILLAKLRAKPVINKYDHRKIIFTADGIQSSLKMRNPIARKIYLALPELIESAKFVWHEKNDDVNKPHKIGVIKGYDWYWVKAKLGISEYLVKIKIEVPERHENDRFNKDDRYYFHSVEEISLA